MAEGDIVWRVRHRAVTESTNKDALGGEPGDVFTADMQTAGRGRLDHRWLSPPGENLMMSAVIGVEEMPPENVATVPLVVGLAVVLAVSAILQQGDRPCNDCDVQLKWPNDVLVRGRKVCGILCERVGDRVIAGVGLNVNQTVFAPEIATRATSLLLSSQNAAATFPESELKLPRFCVADVRDAVLESLSKVLTQWRKNGFSALWPAIAKRDFLKGKAISVFRIDDDAAPLEGVCGGIRLDGSLDVGGDAVFAGEAHVSCCGGFTI